MSHSAAGADALNSLDQAAASTCSGLVMGRGATMRTRREPFSNAQSTPRTEVYAAARRTMSRSRATVPPAP